MRGQLWGPESGQPVCVVRPMRLTMELSSPGTGQPFYLWILLLLFVILGSERVSFKVLWLGCVYWKKMAFSSVRTVLTALFSRLLPCRVVELLSIEMRMWRDRRAIASCRSHLGVPVRASHLGMPSPPQALRKPRLASGLLFHFHVRCTG